MKKTAKKIKKVRTVRSSVLVPDPEQIGPLGVCCVGGVARL